MLPFLRRLAGFAVIQLGIAWGVCVWGTPERADHYLNALQDKVLRLDSLTGRRILALGGSNVAFGVHTQPLQEATGLPCVNLGLHISLGLPFQLELARQHARPSDVVLLLPEYQLLTSEHQDGDGVVIAQLCQQWPEAVRYWPAQEPDSWAQFLDYGALWRAHEWVVRASEALGVTGSSKEELVYTRRGFDLWGNMTAHYARTALRVDYTEPLEAAQDERLDAAVEMINRFTRECGERGIAVFVSYPPLPQTTFEQSAEVVQTVHRQLRAHLEAQVLLSPETFAYPLADFYDTAYHLNRAAGARRSAALGAALANSLSRMAAEPESRR